MASAAAFTAIETKFRADWGSTSALYFENEDWALGDAPAHFLFVEVFGDFYDQASIGAGSRDANLWREEGQVLVHVMTQRGIGSTKARQLAERALDIFRGTDLGSITFREASIGAGEPGDADGNYWRMTASINWQRDEG
jgi:hypothetical protein